MRTMQIGEPQAGEQARLPHLGLLDALNWADKLPMSFGCGCLLGLSAPGFDIWWLAWLGLVPLLVLIQSCRGKLQAIMTGLVFGMGYYMVGLCWYLGLYPLNWLGLSDWLGFEAALSVWLIESLHQSLLFAGFSLFVFALPMRAGLLPYYSRPYFPYLIGVPILWLFFHWSIAPSQVFLGTPVNQLAYSQSHQLELIQMAKFGGSQLVDFTIVLFNTALAVLVIERSGWVRPLADRADLISRRVGPFVDIGLVSLILALSCIWGHWEVCAIARQTALTGPISPERPPVPVAVIQGNITIEDERSGAMSSSEIAKRYDSLVDRLGVALMVLPEGVVNNSRSELLSRLIELTSQQKKEAIAGCLESTGRGSFNACRLIGDKFDPENVYVKRRLVPFGEYIPLGLIGEIAPGQLRSLIVGEGGGFVPAGGLNLPRSIWGRVGASICVEVIYPRLIAEEVRKGASVIVNISNLAWFHNSTLGRQVLAAATMRAVENGRYLVLATNTGISAVIDPSGFVTSASISGRRGVLVDTIQFLYKKTPFTKMWWL